MIDEFLNNPLSDELINRIAEQCAFKGMKKNETSYKVSEEKNSSPFLRKGVVGDQKNYFTPELNARFEKEVLAKFKGTGLEFDFEMLESNNRQQDENVNKQMQFRIRHGLYPSFLSSRCV